MNQHLLFIVGMEQCGIDSTGCVVDTEVNSVTCTTTRFSVFSLFGEPVAQQNSGNTNTSLKVLFLCGHWVKT